MPYAIIHHFPGGTRSQYEAVLAVVHLDGGLPPGQTYHAAGPSEDGWTVFATHDSRGELGAVPRRDADAGVPGRDRRRVHRTAPGDVVRGRDRDQRVPDDGLSVSAGRTSIRARSAPPARQR